MYIGIGVLDLHLPLSRSLKDKRRVVRGLVERLHARFRVSTAETAHHDLLQRAQIGCAIVAADESEALRLLGEVEREALALADVEIVAWDAQVLEEGR